MKHIPTFESFLNEALKVELANKKYVTLKKGDKLTLTDAAKEEYMKTKPHMKKVLDDEFTVDGAAGGAVRVIASDGDSFIIDGSRFQMNESVNESKMIINQSMDKSVKTPYGKGGAKTTVILGKTSSGLAVTLNGDFVDAKANQYVSTPTAQDREEAREMIQFHHDRLKGGLNKEKLAALLNIMVESENMSQINEAVNPEMDKKVKKFIKSIADMNDYSEEDAVRATMEALKRLGYTDLIK